MENIIKALESLERGKVSDLNAYFHEVQTQVNVQNTSAICHLHCLTLDGSDRPRVQGLIEYLMAMICDYAIPRKKIHEAIMDYEQSKSVVKLVKLQEQAKSLFTKIGNSGEAGELILFAMAERFLNLPQIMCKMNLKTSSAMHFHGADGVHVGVDRVSNKLCLYWGESKLHANPTNAIRECFKSIGPILNGSGTIHSPEIRDLQLLQNFLNINDDDLETALKKYFDPDSEEFNHLKYCGICLVGFDSEEYPLTPNTKTINEVKSAIDANLKAWQTRLHTRLTEEQLTSFNIHVFFLPFPSVEDFRDKFKKALEG